MKLKAILSIVCPVLLIWLGLWTDGQVSAQGTTHMSMTCGDNGTRITGNTTPLVLSGNVFVYSSGTGTNSAVIEAPLNLGSTDRSFTIYNSNAEKDLLINGSVTGSNAGMIKEGDGNLSLDGQAVSLNSLTLNGGTFTSTSSILSLSGSFTNNATFAPNTGTVTLSGMASQGIGGSAPSSFFNLVLNNAEGATLGNSEAVTGTLTLSNGLLQLGNYNLTLGSAAVAGSPGATAMIVTNGSGECRRLFTASGSYTFPVGDITGTADYSPITLDFVSGSYADAWAGARVTNAKHPANSSTTNYLNRYWSVTSSGISNFRCNITGNYVTEDVAGSEAGQAAGQYTGTLPWLKYAPLASNTLTAEGVVSFSDFTGITLAPPSVSITANPGFTVVQGTPLSLTAVPTGDANFTYSWNPGGGTTPTISVPTGTAGSTLYTVTITDGNGFTAGNSATVIVQATPGGLSAAVTTITAVSACEGAETIDVPVKVSSFSGVGSISLKLTYDSLKLGRPLMVEDSLPAGIAAWDTWIMNTDVNGTVAISAYGPLPSDGVSLANGATLFCLRFPVLATGVSSVSFRTDIGTYCEYAGVAPDYPVFTDDPPNLYYFPGTVSVNPRRTISGVFNYYNTAHTPLTTSLQVQLVRTSGPGADPLTTSQNPQQVSGSGGYSFAGVCSACTYEILAVSTQPTDGAVNTTDAAQVNAWPGLLYTIENGRFYAADVKGNNNFINAQDAQRIQSNFVNGTPFDRPGGWSFWKVGETPVTSNLNQPNQPVPTVTLGTGGNLTQNMYGLCIGDFNRSFNPGLMKAASASLDLVDGTIYKAGSLQEIEIPVRVVNASELGAVSLILNFPSGLVSIDDVTMEGMGGTLDWAVRNDNELRIGWNTLNPVYLDAGNVLLNLKLRTTDAFTSGQNIRFTLAANPLNELANGTYNVIGHATLAIGTIESTTFGIPVPGTPGTWNLELRSSPNPFSDFTTLSYSLPSDGKVTLEINSPLGIRVTTLVSETQASGNHTVEFHTPGLTAGVYIATLKLQTKDDLKVRTIKLVFNK